MYIASSSPSASTQSALAQKNRIKEAARARPILSEAPGGLGECIDAGGRGNDWQIEKTIAELNFLDDDDAPEEAATEPAPVLLAHDLAEPTIAPFNAMRSYVTKPKSAKPAIDHVAAWHHRREEERKRKASNQRDCRERQNGATTQARLAALDAVALPADLEAERAAFRAWLAKGGARQAQYLRSAPLIMQCRHVLQRFRAEHGAEPSFAQFRKALAASSYEISMDRTTAGRHVAYVSAIEAAGIWER